MWIGWIEFELLLGDVHSLKAKRGLIKPIIADLSRRTEAACGQVGHLNEHRRAALGLSVVAPDGAHVRDVLDRAERLIAEEHPEVVLLSARRGLANSED